MSALGMTEEELEQVARACRWVRMTAGFLPYMRNFLLARLAHQAVICRKITQFTPVDKFRLWEHLKDQQLFPFSGRQESKVGTGRNIWSEAKKDGWMTF